MINELGHFALVLAFAISIAQSIIPMWGAYKGHAEPMRFAQWSAITAFLLVGLSFAALTHAFINSDFSLRIVAANSHSLKPFLYKISGVWGNHEGSMLLWVLILTLFGALVAAMGKNIPQELKARTLSVQGMIGVAFLAFILFTSNPFSFAVAALIEGRVDAGWARWVRPWTLLAWAGLTIGIALGSYWAYYELGWGGWWFWDPG